MKSSKSEEVSPEQMERFRRLQIVAERERFGMHRFSKYIPNISQNKRRRLARSKHI